MARGRKRGSASKGCKSRMSASTMEALKLFHERAVAVSQMPAGSLHAGHLTESLNDQRMLRPVDRRSSTAPRQRGQETTSKPAELSVDVPPGLQQLLDSFKTMYTRFYQHMQSAEYRRDIEQKIDDETKRRQVLLSQLERLENEVSNLQASGVASLDDRLEELSMSACSPLDFFHQATSIVQQHEQLKIASASLQQTLHCLESHPRGLPSSVHSGLLSSSELPSFAEFFHNNAHSENQEGLKTKSQGSRNRRRYSRTRTSRRPRATVKSKDESAGMTCKQQFIPETRGFAKFSSESQPNLPYRQAITDMVPCDMLGTSTGCARTLTYAEKMKKYIAHAIIEDSDNDESQSPPTLSRVYSDSTVVTSSEPHYFSSCNTRLDNVSGVHSGSVPSIKHTVPCTDPVTPCRLEADIYNGSPAVKRRLFNNTLSAVSEANSDSGISCETIDKRVRHRNGYHSLQKVLTSSLNGRMLGPVDHYEDGLLAIANAACLMSTGVSDGSHSQNKLSGDQVAEASTALNDKCSFAALLGYASSQLNDVVSNGEQTRPTNSSGLKQTGTTLPRYFGMWRDRSKEMV